LPECLLVAWVLFLPAGGLAFVLPCWRLDWTLFAVARGFDWTLFLAARGF
jgi:hypothetical protein